MKKILVLGGTHFIGRLLVEKLIEKNQYDITLFNRQKTQAHLFADIKKIKGDRETDDINQLIGPYWDVIIDLSAYFPNSLEKFIKELEGKVGRYIFISTLSVLDLDNDDDLKSAIDENYKIHTCDETQKVDKSMQSYGARKAACERILLESKTLDKIILRPSIVYGQYDWTDRFYYWLYLSKMNFPILMPDAGKDLISLTYVDDLVNIMIEAIEIQNHSTVYNVTTHDALSLAEMIGLIDKNAHNVDITSEKLIELEIQAGRDIPLWFSHPFIINNSLVKNDFKISFKSFSTSIEETKKYYEYLNWPIPNVGMSEASIETIIRKID